MFISIYHFPTSVVVLKCKRGITFHRCAVSLWKNVETTSAISFWCSQYPLASNRLARCEFSLYGDLVFPSSTSSATRYLLCGRQRLPCPYQTAQLSHSILSAVVYIWFVDIWLSNACMFQSLLLPLSSLLLCHGNVREKPTLKVRMKSRLNLPRRTNIQVLTIPALCRKLYLSPNSWHNPTQTTHNNRNRTQRLKPTTPNTPLSKNHKVYS